ncbi:MAG: DNA polymerase/3'-5' exonuclease PolX [Phycisphaerales bacterium]|nr:DNA polymerase/3'-5' exonuclease PolX [Phycisphaerales bacterium]
MSFNHNASAIFTRIAQMLELTGADRFRVNAANKASRILKELTTDLEPLAQSQDSKALTAIEGLGKSTVTKLIQLATTNTISEHEELSNKIPQGLMQLLAIPGLGPKTVKLMWDELKIESIDDLKNEINKGTVADLPRMGDKTIKNITDALTFMESSGGRLHLGLAMPIANHIVEHMLAVEGTTRAQYAGSLRRGQETIGDIDILITTTNPQAARDAFTAMEPVTKILANGDTKSSIRYEISTATGRFKDLTTPDQIQIDLRIVSQESWGAALAYFTGSKEHNVALRKIAIKHNMTLNEYGLYNNADNRNDPIACESEAGIYAALGLDVVPPPMRQDRGELTNGHLPHIIELADIKADLHTHTTDSDGKLTLKESATIARNRNFHTLAITDHSQSSAIANGLKPERLQQQIKTIHDFNASFDNLTIIAGSEVDILVDGSLDYNDDLLNQLDIVVASPHAGLRAKPKQATKRLLKAIAHPAVHILGHPTGRLIQRREGLSPDMTELIAAAVQHDVALEINAHWMRLDLRDTHVRAAAEAGCKIAINCDVHHAADYDNLIFGILTAQRGWLTPDLCINTWDHDKLHTWLKSKR